MPRAFGGTYEADKDPTRDIFGNSQSTNNAHAKRKAMESPGYWLLMRRMAWENFIENLSEQTGFNLTKWAVILDPDTVRSEEPLKDIIARLQQMSLDAAAEAQANWQEFVDMMHKVLTGDTNAGHALQEVQAAWAVVWKDLWKAVTGDDTAEDKLPADLALAQAAMRNQLDVAHYNAEQAVINIQDIIDKLWYSLMGGTAVGHAMQDITDAWRVVWNDLWDAMAGQTGATDKLPADLALVSAALKARSDLAHTNAEQAVLNIQNIIDNIHEALTGNALPGQPLLTIKTNLQNAWAKLWEGLTGGTSTSKLPSDVKTAAAAVTSTATTASANANTGLTNIQSIVDNIHQSIVGGTSTNNALATIKTNLQNSWTNFWQGLTGGTATGKLPSDVKTAAAAVKSTSDTASTNATTAIANAATADAKAVTADGKAVTADGKAVTAQTWLQTTIDNIHQAINGGTTTNNALATVKTNLQTAWSSFWEGLTGGTGSNKLPSDVKTAAASVKSTSDTASTNATTAIANAATADGKAVTADGKAVTAQTWLQTTVDNIHQAINGGTTTNNALATVKTNLQNTWTNFWQGLTGGTATGKLPSDVKTAAAAVKSTADTASTNATTGIANAATADSKAVTADGKAVTAQTWLQTTVDNIHQAINGGTSTNNALATVKTNLQDAWTNFWQGLTGGTQTGKLPSDVKTAAASVKSTSDTASTNASTAIGNAATAQSTANTANSTANTATTNLQTVVDGAVQAVDGGSATGAAASTFKTKLQLAWANLWDGLNGTSGATTKLPSDVKTVAGAVRSTATTASTNATTAIANAATADAKAVTADGKAVTADGKAVTADGKAVTAQTWLQTTVDNIHQSINGGTTTNNALATVKTNLQDAWTNFWQGLTGGTQTGKLPTDVKTAAAAVKSTSDTASTNASTAIGNAATADSKAVAAQGTANTANSTANTATTNLQTVVDGAVQAVDGGSATGAAASTFKTKLQLAWANLWDGLNGTSGATTKLPSDVKTVAGAVRSTATTASTNATTAIGNAATADAKAVAAQAAADAAAAALKTAATIGPSLVPDGGFENSYVWSPAPSGTNGGVQSSEQAKAGTKSWKMTAAGTSLYCHTVATQLDRTLVRKVTEPGRKYWCEAWVYPHANNSHAAGTVYINGELHRTGGTPWTYPGAINVATSTLVKGQWQKLSGVLDTTAYSDVYEFSVYLGMSSTCTAGDIFYWDEVRVVDITEAYDAKVIADAATTNLQTVVDGAVQAVDGGSATGAAASTFKTKLQLAWANLWDGLNGTTGATSKLPSDVKTVATAVKSTASTASTNASTAIGNAATADAKAVTARNLAVSSIASSNNILSNPGFEDTTFWVQTSMGGAVTTEVARSGTRSLKLTGNGANRYAFILGSDTGQVNVPAAPGEVYYLEVWVYGKATNTGNTGTIYFGLQCYNGALAYIANVQVYGPAASTAYNGTWTKISGYVTLPANTAWMSPFVDANSIISNDVYYWDDAVVREVTNSQIAVDSIVQAVDGGSATGATPSTVVDKLKLAWANLWDGLNGTTGATSKLPADVKTVATAVKSTASTASTNATTAIANAATADGKAVDLYNRFDSYAGGGPGNICTNPSFEDTTQYLSNATYSSAKSRLGTYSAALAGTGATRYLELATNKTTRLKVIGGPSRTYYIECWVYGDDANTIYTGAGWAFVIGIWTYTSASAGTGSEATISASFDTIGKSQWVKLSGTVTTTSNTDVAQHRPLAYIHSNVTAGNTVYVDDVKIIDITEANVADANAAAAQSTANTGVSNAATAQSTANTATTNLQTTVDAVVQAVDGGTATGAAHTTVKTKLQDAWTNFWQGLTGLTQTGKLPTDVKTAAAAVKSTSDTANTNANTGIANAATADGKAVTADGKAVTARTLSVNAMSGGANIIPDPSFEYSDDLYKNAEAYPTTEQAHIGAKSIRINGRTWPTTYHLARTDIGTYFFPTTAGDVWYMEYWIRGKSTNTQSDTVGLGRMEIGCYNEAGASFSWQRVSFFPNTSYNNTWTKVSGYVTMPAGTVKAVCYLYMRDFNDGEVYYFDDVVCYRVTEVNQINQALYSANSPASTVLGTAVPALDAGKITTGTLPNSRIGSDLDASKLTSGTLPISRIAAGAVTNTYLGSDINGGKISAGTILANFIASLDASKITTGSLPAARVGALPQNQINGLTSRLGSTDNLVSNPGFEDTSFYLGSGIEYSTTRMRSGSYSAKWTAAGTDKWLELCTTDTGNYGVSVGPGTVVYMEMWVRGETTNTGNTGGLYLYAQGRPNPNGGGSTLDNMNVASLSCSTSYNNTWTKIAGYATFTNALTVSAHFGIYCNASVQSGDIYYVDDVTVRIVTDANQINQALYASNTASSTVLGTAVPALDAGKITTGSLPNARIGSDLDAAKLTSGTLPISRIAAGAVTNNYLGSDINGGKITAGTILANFIASLDASKITTGLLPNARIDTGLDAAKLTTGTLPIARIGSGAVTNTYLGSDINGGKITAGTVAATYIASLDAGKITTGTLPNARIGSDLDGSKITAGTIAEARVQNLTTTITNLQSTTDNVVNALTGNDGQTGTALADALAALKQTYTTLTKHTNDIAALQTSKSAASSKGKQFTIDFGNYADMTGLTDFTISYSGAGTSVIGVSNGLACWKNTNNADRTAKIIYNTATDTDFQVLRGTMSTPPESAVGGGTPKFHAIGRVSSDGLNYVWARAYSTGSWMQFRGEMGYCVNGTEYTWASDIPLTWSLDMTFYIGVGTAARTYQVWSGNTKVYEHVESGTSSMMGASYRKWGSIAQIKSGTFGPRHSGQLGGCAAADNQTPTVYGSTARMYRSSTSTVNFTGGSADNVLSSFFDAVDYESLDVDADTTSGAMKIVTAKTYSISARVKLASGTSPTGWLVLQRSTNNGSSWSDLAWGDSSDVKSGGALTGSWVQYLNAGDWVRLSARESGATMLNCLTGGDSGASTYFSINGVLD